MHLKKRVEEKLDENWQLCYQKNKLTAQDKNVLARSESLKIGLE